MSDRSPRPARPPSSNHGIALPSVALAPLVGLAPTEAANAWTVMGAGLTPDNWWWTTFFSMLVIALTWAGASALLHFGRRMRWIGPASKIRLSRIMQVGFGAALLAAVLLPYLLAHAPRAAVLFSLMLAALTFPFIGGAADTQQLDSEPPG